MEVTKRAAVRIMAPPKTWIEGDAGRMRALRRLPREVR